MPRKVSRIRRRYIEGETEVLHWELEETLVYGGPVILGPHCGNLTTLDEWRVAWDRWRDVVLPKAIEYRPGLRPVAQYVVGEIPARELITPLPKDSRHPRIEVLHPGGRVVTHYLDAPMPFLLPEVEHLRRLGIVDDQEYQRHREWMSERNPECDQCSVDHYVLEMATFA